MRWQRSFKVADGSCDWSRASCGGFVGRTTARAGRANCLSQHPRKLGGLFALHVIGQEPLFPLAWDVDCATDQWLAANGDRLRQFPTLSALGYGLSLFRATAPPDGDAAFAAGAASLRTRPPFPRDRFSFAYQPVAFLGLALGAVALGEQTAPFKLGY